MSDAKRKPLVDAAESETLRMRGNSLHGNRETLETPSPKVGEGRSEKALCRTADMYVSRESDGPIVPEKRANNAGPKAAAESVEGRGLTKGNAEQTLLVPDAVPERRGMGLLGIREAAEKSAFDRQLPKVGAVCGSSARTDPCGGRRETGVPTANPRNARERLQNQN